MKRGIRDIEREREELRVAYEAMDDELVREIEAIRAERKTQLKKQTWGNYVEPGKIGPVRNPYGE